MKAFIWLAIVALAIAAFFGTHAAGNVFKKERAVNSGLERATEDLADLNERKEALENTLQGLDAERGIEEEIRKRFPLMKPGEEVIVLLDAKNPSGGAEEPSRRGFWQSILDLFSR